VSVLEHNVCRGVAHPVMQRPGVLYLADESEVYFVWQPSQESSVFSISRAFDDYYISHLDAGGDAEEDLTSMTSSSSSPPSE
jgi:hypothetical protein